MKTTVIILVVTCIVFGFTLQTQAEASTRIKDARRGIDASLSQSVVIIATGGVPLKDSGNSIDIIPEGTTVRVIEINDDRLSVEWHGQHGRIYKNDVVSTVDAIDYYPQKISRNSNPNDFTLRGRILSVLGKYDKAIADYTEAIRHNPNYDFAYYNRRVGFGKKGQSNKTLADFHQEIRLNPQDSLQHLSAIAPVFLLMLKKSHRQEIFNNMIEV